MVATDGYQKKWRPGSKRTAQTVALYTALSEERGLHFFVSSEMTALKKVYVVITFPCSVMNWTTQALYDMFDDDWRRTVNWREEKQNGKSYEIFL